MAKPFVDLQRNSATTQEAEQLTQPYAQQQQLLRFLKKAFVTNAKILRDHGYPYPRRPGALRPTPSGPITEQRAIEAADTIDAVVNVYRALLQSDKCAIANASIWLGLIIGDEQFRLYQGRKRSGKRQPRVVAFEEQAFAILERARLKNRTLNYNALLTEMQLQGSADATPDKCRDVIRQFNKRRRT